MVSRRRATLIAVFLVIPFFLIDCAKNPVTGRRQIALISESQEIAMGREAHPEVLVQFGEVRNQALQSYFAKLGKQIAAVSHRPDLPWQFTLVDDPLVNAFAVPGGYIYLTRGILAYMNNEAELAGVLGHEIAHVTARHSVSQLSKAQLFNLGLGVGTLFSPTFQQLSSLAQMGVGVLFLKYSRDDEREADKLGVEYMYRLGYDPRELGDFFTVFQRMREEQGQAIPSWLSSHPAPPERVENTKQYANELTAQGASRNLKVNSQIFLNKLQGVIFGENPREGFAKDGTFYHPDLSFRLAYPPTWQVRNSRAAVLFLEPRQSVGLKLSLAPSESRSPRGRAQQLAQQPGVNMLQGDSRRINGRPAYLAIYDVSDQSGNRIQALAAFIDYGGHLFELVGMGTPANFQRFQGSLERIIMSFQRLQDKKVLSVQPDRIQLYRVKRGGTLMDVAQLYPNSRVDVSDLAVLNRIDQSARLKPGTVLKVVKAGY
jgi:predicted Zn-dependent protease